MKRWPIIVAVLMLLGTWGLLQSRSHAEPPLDRKPFSEFPMTLGGKWKGVEVGMEQSVLDILKLTDYMQRYYAPTQGTNGLRKGETLPVWLYVGYYQSQRTGATYHSPKNCLPGAGWQFMESEHVPIEVPGWPPIIINRVLIQKGLEKQVILYWYQDRGRVIASEYWAKAYLLWDAMKSNRTDGALVRISVPVNQSTEQAYAQGVEFLREIYPRLRSNLPS
jgi:EpsI family protein